jgi:gamma-glutamylcyclotransferase
MLGLYFAYGSNMSTRRLRARIPEATALGRGRLEGWRLACNKHGRDGSGKANLISEEASLVWGVLFSIPKSEWPTLDRFEWGYERRTYSVSRDDGRVEQALAYLADPTGPTGLELRPHGWYLDHLLEGAREHSLPEAYIRELEAWQVLAPDIDANAGEEPS